LDILFKIIGLLSIPLLLLSVILMIRGLRKERSIRSLSLIFPALISLIILIVYTALLNNLPPTAWSAALLLTGLFIGSLQSRTTRLAWSNGKITGKRSAWYLVVWGIAFTITQLLVLFGPSKAAAYGLLTIYLSTGLNLGVNATLLIRYFLLKSKKQVQGTICPVCGHNNEPGIKFCTGCGKTLPEPRQPEKPAAFCTKCGSILQNGQNFCTVCGMKQQSKSAVEP
jgi:hypothetical protein